MGNETKLRFESVQCCGGYSIPSADLLVPNLDLPLPEKRLKVRQIRGLHEFAGYCKP